MILTPFQFRSHRLYETRTWTWRKYLEWMLTFGIIPRHVNPMRFKQSKKTHVMDLSLIICCILVFLNIKISSGILIML